MEKSIMVAEDYLRTDSTHVSTSGGSLIKINSISIDLLNANDEGHAEKCEHFSIRGYVSKIRKKNKKIGWPFSMDGNDNKSEGATHLLPPLDVQKFRWWRCKNCLQNIVAGCAEKDNEAVSYPCHCVSKSNATCAHVSSLDAGVLPLDCQQPPKPFLIEGRKFDANTFTNMANNEDLPLSRTKERKFNNSLIGRGNGLTGMHEKNSRPTCITAKVNPCTQEKHTNGSETGAPKSKCNGSVGVVKGGTIVGEELNSATSESDEIKSNGAPRRKFRKVRLLAELLGDKGVAKTDCKKTSGSCSNAVSDVFLRQGTVSILQGPVAVQGANVRCGFMGQNKKRKLPQDEEWRPPAMSSLNNENVKVMASEDAETESESEEDAVVGANLQMGLDRSLTKHRVEKDATLAIRKNKKTHVIDLNKSHSESGDISEADGTTDVLLSSVQDTFTDQVTDPFPSHDQRMKRKSNLYETESKMRQVDDGLASVNPLHDATLAAVPTAGKDKEVLHTKILTVPIQSAQQASTKRQDLPPKNYLTTTRYDKIYSPLAGGLPSSLPWHEDTNQGMREGRDTNFIGHSRVLSKSALNGVYGNGVNGDLSRKEVMYKMPYLDDKHKHSSQVEHGVGSLMQQMPFSNPSNNEKTVEDQEHLAVTKKHTSRRADKISEQGTLDDIPMEIVELMAKNQYERCLHDAKREKQHSETTNKRSAQILDFTGGYGNKEFRSLPDEATRKHKPQAKNGRDGIRRTGDYMGATKQKFHENPSSEVQFYAASSSGHNSPQNCLWIGERARPSYSIMQPLSACNTCQTQPQQSKESAGLWPSTIPNHTPFGFNISRKCEAQSTNVEMLSRRPSSLHKRDHAMKFTNANAANHGKHQKNLGYDTLVRTHPDYSFGCKHRTDLPKKISGSLDLYSNETIPAMHLLSLMDAGVRSGASSSRKETQKLLKKPLFPAGHHSQEPPAQQPGVSLEHFPAIQIGSASTSSFQRNRNFQRVTNFTGQVSLQGPQKAKTKTYKISSENGLQKSHKFALSRCSSEEMFFGDLHSPSSFFQSHLIGGPMRKQKLDANVWPLKTNLETEVCSVNRNPADFSIPGARNEYMIRGEDLKFGKRFPTYGGFVHNKIHKNVKLNAANERVRQRNRGKFYQQQ